MLDRNQWHRTLQLEMFGSRELNVQLQPITCLVDVYEGRLYKRS